MKHTHKKRSPFASWNHHQGNKGQYANPGASAEEWADFLQDASYFLQEMADLCERFRESFVGGEEPPDEYEFDDEDEGCEHCRDVYEDERCENCQDDYDDYDYDDDDSRD